jgi:hypothetical protein
MKKLLLLALLTLATACSSSNDKKSNDDHTSAGATQVDTTDYKECDRGTPPRDIRGAWAQSSESNGLTTQFVVEIDEDSVRFTTHCAAQGHDLTASAVTEASWDDTVLSVLGIAEDHKSLNVDDFHMNCDVNMKPIKLKYSFKGSCLVLAKSAQPQDILTLVPVR